jgi:hypothetical protein
MSNKKVIAIIILATAGLCLAALARAQLLSVRTRTSSLATRNRPSAIRGRAEMIPSQNSKQDEPTEIQEGVLTDRQKAHSKLFKNYGVRNRGKKLKDTNSGDVSVTIGIGDSPLPRNFDLDKYLRDGVCTSDAVVIGTINKKSSQLVEDETFTFTEYDLTVEEVLKNSSVAPISVGNNLTVVRPGGTVKLNGRVMRAVDSSEKPLEVNGRVLLFLQYLPQTRTYESHLSDVGDMAFHIRGNQIFQVSEELLPFGKNRPVDLDSFLGRVRSSINGACSN